MKQSFEPKKKEKINREESKKISEIKNAIIIAFSVCLSSLFIFFALDDKVPKKEFEASEIVSVFKETYLYEFLDFGNCENSKNHEGSV